MGFVLFFSKIELNYWTKMNISWELMIRSKAFQGPYVV